VKRKKFIQLCLSGSAFVGLSTLLYSCADFVRTQLKLRRAGVGADIGHLVRTPLNGQEKISQTFETDVLIIGGGISGLTAGYFLQKQSKLDYKILELDKTIGGNSQSGENSFSKFPYGAHYLPIPNSDDHELIQFLVEKKIINSIDEDGLPFFNEDDLCHDPHERILQNNYWNEGLMPVKNLTPKDKNELDKFLSFAEILKNVKGPNDKYVFQIPIHEGDLNDDWRKLDEISFKQYLIQQGYSSDYLFWYLNYSCRDDFGQGIEHISAFAGLHYFAARRGKGANCKSNEVLTWAEGNGKLVSLLAETQGNQIHTNQIVRSISVHENGVEIVVQHTSTKEFYLYNAKKIIMAIPFHVRQKLLPLQLKSIQAPSHQPWLVSTILLSHFDDKHGFPICWDNVFKEGKSLGFINNRNQYLGTNTEIKNCFTLYMPLDDDLPSQTRKNYYTKSDEELKQTILNEWKKYYPNIEDSILELDFMLWGHGMVSPGIHYLCHPERNELRKPIDNKVYFAHTDYSGISIFEEAFWQGKTAVNELLK